MNLVRRFVLWWMAETPYVTANISVDFGNARAYLDKLNETEPRVSVQHLFCATVARVYAAHPVANRRVVGGRIYQAPNVGIAMPVDLLGRKGEAVKGEVTMMALREADTLSLRRIAELTRKNVGDEREGRSSDPWIDLLWKLAQGTPGPLQRMTWRQAGRLAHTPLLSGLIWRQAPITTAISNPGSTYAGSDKIVFRGASIQPPSKFLHIGSLWGLSGVQDEAVARDGQVVVRPMLPVMMCWDHRLFDGVMASRIIRTLVETLQDPEAAFGPEGERRVAG
jgi:pyruvate/2-oxoglutarate dehydrogenase complex dihydrolipoamide acyltransferase (E2) component